jgi:glycosyltransferase involved in cell wall biosynthesis
MNKVIISIIIPIYNEEQALKKNFYKIYKFLSKNFISFEIILIESGSSDKSNLLCKEYSKLKKVKLLIQKKRDGFGSAVRFAIKNISGQYFCVVPIDLCFDLKILNILNKKKFDLLTSYRVKDTRSLFRLTQSYVYNIFIKLIFDLNFKSVNSAPKIFRSKFIKNKKLHSKGWSIDAEILFYYKKKDIEHYCVPSEIYNRKIGQSSIKISDIFKILYQSIIIRIKIYLKK